MAIRQRRVTTPVEEAEVETEAGNVTISRADDLRGTFDPANDPFPHSIVGSIHESADDALDKRQALGLQSRALFTNPDLNPLPSESRVVDLLANLRITNNGNDSVERTYRNRIKSPLTAIRAMCVDCKGGSPRAVSSCDAMACPFWSFRMGKNTWRGRSSK